MSESPPTLRELQEWMAAQIALAPHGGAEPVLTVPPGVDLEERLGVYVGGYPSRIHAALGEAFPALAHVIGARSFAELAGRYRERVASLPHNLNDVGAHLPELLRDDPIAEGFPFAADLAELEWRVTRAFHSFEEAPLDPAELAGWSLEDWERAVLRFQPSLALVRSPWPILDIWNHRNTPIQNIDIALEGRPDIVLVHRCGFDVHCDSIEPTQADALQALLDGRSLGEVAIALAESGEEAVAVSTWFSEWMRQGLVCGCELRAAQDPL